MKIGLTASSEGMDSDLSTVFGRCPYFIIVETDENEIKNSKTVKNTAINQRGGAGISAAQIIGDQGVEVVISGNIGPRAFGVLQQMGVEIYEGSNGSIKENVNNFLKGELEKQSSPGQMGRGTNAPSRSMGRGRGGQGRGMNR